MCHSFLRQLSANILADTVERLFDVDYDIEEQYNTLLNGTTNIFYSWILTLSDAIFR
jgi:hypothetical protein